VEAGKIPPQAASREENILLSQNSSAPFQGFFSYAFSSLWPGQFSRGDPKKGREKKNSPPSLIFVFHFRFQKKQRENEQKKTAESLPCFSFAGESATRALVLVPRAMISSVKVKKDCCLLRRKRLLGLHSLTGNDPSHLLSFNISLNSTQNTSGPAQLPLEAVVFTAAAAKRRRNGGRAEPEAAAPFENGDDERRNQTSAIVVVVDASSSSSSATPTSVFVFFPAAAAPPLPARRGGRARAPGRSPDAGAQIHTRHRRRELRDQDVSFEAF
jgi:hypothetical protein